MGSARKEWSGSAGQGLSQRRAEREAAFDFEKEECLQGHSKYSMLLWDPMSCAPYQHEIARRETGGREGGRERGARRRRRSGAHM